MSRTGSNKKKGYPYKRQMKRKIRRIVSMVVVALLAAGVNYYNNHNETQTTRDNNNKSLISNTTEKNPYSKIRQAILEPRSGFWLTLSGKVIKTLSDDRQGSQHQRFLIKAAPDITLLVSHNIDLAPRVPLRKGNQLQLRGVYEWNNKGGLIHWTHHDPGGRKKGGWIKLNGKVYQ